MIYLTRHGQTEWNLEGRMQGRMESALTPLGVRQAGAMAGLIGDLVERDGTWWQADPAEDMVMLYLIQNSMPLGPEAASQLATGQRMGGRHIAS